MNTKPKPLHRTETIMLASAMDVLAREIRCADGIATAAIAEAAQRLREQEWEIAGLTQAIGARKAETARQREKIARLTVALKDAISTYDPDRDETLVTAERQEAWAAALSFA